MEDTKKILVTGGAGFIGSHTVLSLKQQGYTPVIVDNFSNSLPSVLDGISAILNESIVSHNIDCNDQQAMDKVFKESGPFHGVIHFAAYKAVGESVQLPLKYYHNNVGSLMVLLSVMEKHGVQNLVFSSSCTVYGEPEDLPVTESFPTVKANSPYGNTKQICEEIIQDLVSSGSSKLNATLLRYFNPIGAHPSGLIGELPLGVPNNLVPFITQCAYGLREKITVFGHNYPTSDGTCIRDYIHVVDLAEAHVRALDWLEDKRGKCEVFNLGTGQGHSVLEVIKGFEKANDTEVNYVLGDRRSGDVASIYADAAKSKEVLGWHCKYGLEDALRDAWRWERNYRTSQKNT